MPKVIAAWIAGAFALGSVAVFADDQTPPQPVDRAWLKAEREQAKAAYANMTPEEKTAYKKAKAEQKQKQLDAQEAKATNNPPTTAAQQKALNAAKAQPKELATPAARQDALKQQEKEAVKAGGG